MTSLRKVIDPVYRRERSDRRNARAMLERFKQAELRDLLGEKPGPFYPRGELIGFHETKQRTRVPIIRQKNYGKSKYAPAVEDRKHAASGRRTELPDRLTRRFLRDALTGKHAEIRPALSGGV